MSSVLYSVYLKFAENKIRKTFLNIIFCQILLSVFECGVNYIKNTTLQTDKAIRIELMKEISMFLLVLFVVFVGLLFIKKVKSWHKIEYEEKTDELVVNCENLKFRLPICFIVTGLLSSFFLYLSCTLASYYYWLYPNYFGNHFFVSMICVFIICFFTEIFLFLSIKETIENAMISLLFFEKEKYYLTCSIFERYLAEKKEIVVRTEEIDFGLKRFVELGIFVPLFKIDFSKNEEAKEHKITITERHLERYLYLKNKTGDHRLQK